MGLFGSSDDHEDESGRQADPDQQVEDNRTEHKASERARERSTAIAEQVKTDGYPANRIEDLVAQLEAETTERVVAARALVRIARYGPETLAPVGDRAIETLGETILARPIAERILSSASMLAVDNIAYDVVAGQTLEALDEGLWRLTQLRRTDGTVPGGGASEVAVGDHLREHADRLSGKKRLSVEATADALEDVPRALARQARLDPLGVRVDMRAAQMQDDYRGIDTERGELVDATDPAMAIPFSTVQGRITDGVTLGLLVALTHGTVTQLATLTGQEPFPE